jgi:hypothetical protein
MVTESPIKTLNKRSRTANARKSAKHETATMTGFRTKKTNTRLLLKRFFDWSALTLFLLMYSGGASAAAGAHIVASADTACTLQVDGQPAGGLQPGATNSLEVAPGTHLLQAMSLDGLDQWSLVTTVSPGGEERIAIALLPVRNQRLQAAAHDQQMEEEYKKQPTWTDAHSGLVWAREDNGTDVNHQEATVYCENLRTGGYSDWKLPSLSQLAALYDPTTIVKGQRVRGGLSLTGWTWSGDVGTSPSEAGIFLFRFGARASFPIGERSHLRALCVRKLQ